MSKEGRLSRVGVLAPAALSACMDASVLAVPAASAIVSTVLQELSKAFMLKKWFHGSMSAKEAEQLMMEKGKNGSFLVRESRAHPGDYVLTVRVRRRVSHVIIRKLHNKYDAGSGEQFDDLVGLIEHFRSFPIVETSGDVLRLLQPLSGSCVRAKELDRCAHDMQRDDESHYEQNMAGIDEEFHSLQIFDNLHYFTTIEASKPENAPKNRYKNVLPYDQTRVVLGKKDNGCDYINANYIRSPPLCWNSASSVQSSNESLDSVKSLILRFDSKKPTLLVSKSLSDDALREMRRCIRMDRLNGNISNETAKEKIYIATQGCLSNTKYDFWRMIWQEDVRVIVMITKEIERGKKKCEKYWPELLKEEQYDEFKVVCSSERVYEDYLVRELDIWDEQNTCKTIYQYQYSVWPDHGAPTDVNGVLNFISDINRRLSNVMQAKDRPLQGILCVHCSAGVGRTGTFIALDMLIDKIKSTGSNCDLDVHNTVKIIRAQRCGMVQNKAQYRFIYLALKEYIDINNHKMSKKVYMES